MTGWWGGDHPDPVVVQAMAYGASQDPGELANALRAAEAVSPQVIVEIGCDRGGTLYAWRQLCGRVYGITTTDNGYDSGGSGKPLEDHGAVVHYGDSHDPATRAWLVTQLRGGTWSCVRDHVAGPCGVCTGCTWAQQQAAAGCPADVLVIDGDHTPAGVRQDLADYGPLVRAGGLILLHDITPGDDPRAQVWRAWPALAARYATEEIHNPDGGFGWGLIKVRDGDTFKGDHGD